MAGSLCSFGLKPPYYGSELSLIRLGKYSRLDPRTPSTMHDLYFESDTVRLGKPDLRTPSTMDDLYFESGFGNTGCLAWRYLASYYRVWQSSWVNEQRWRFSEELKLLCKQLPVTTKGLLLRMLPFLNSDSVPRLGSRMKHGVMDFDERCPYILPQDSILFTLIVRNAHQAMLYRGPQIMLSYLQRQYWITTGRCLITKVWSRCVTCARYRAATSTPLMG